MCFRLLDGGVVVALVAVGLTHALGVFLELGGVKGLRKEILEDDRMRKADGLEILHRAAQRQGTDVLVAGEFDHAHLHGGAFLDVEIHLHRGGRNGLDLGLDGGKLVAVLGENVLEDSLSPLDLGGIVLALDCEADLFLFEAVEHIRLRDGVEAFVVDLADGGPFPNENIQDDAFLRVLALDAHIVEVARVPERVEVALDGDWVIGVAGVGKETRQHRLFRDAPVADDPN